MGSNYSCATCVAELFDIKTSVVDDISTENMMRRSLLNKTGSNHSSSASLSIGPSFSPIPSQQDVFTDGFPNDNKRKSDDDDEFDEQIAVLLTYYSVDDVSKHNSIDKGIWIIIGSDVFDITEFIRNNLHPASSDFIIPYFGKDASEAYDLTFHSNEADIMLEKYKIGSLKKDGTNNKLDKMISVAPFLGSFKKKKKSMKVTQLFIYPVKGCCGISVDSLLLTNNGFQNDRIYAFVNYSTMKIINQLTHPKLSTIQINDISSSGITLNNKYIPYIKNKILKVKWKSTVFDVYDQGNDISVWITQFFDDNDKYIFVRVCEDNYRETSEYFALSFAPNSSQLMSGFQNYASVLMSSEESLIELNRRYKERLFQNSNNNINDEFDEKEINWDRFRMNIIINGVPLPHFEDFMKHVSFGPKDNHQNAELLWSRRRYFCAVPQVNQILGKSLASQEPLNTAQRYRNAITLNDRTSLPADRAVFFGSFFGIMKKGNIHIGQEVHSKHEELNYKKTRTNHGKSFYGLKSTNVGSQFSLDFYAQYQEFKLISREEYNYNTIKLRFQISSYWSKPYHTSLHESLKMGDHYLLKFIDDNDNIIIRAYTPLPNDSDNGNEMSLDLLIKVYSSGKMTQHLNNMKINDIILGKQNYGKICYYEINEIRFGDPRHTMYLSYTMNINCINLICGGSGITPIYQIINNINLNTDIDNTKLSVIYCNRTFDDILLKNELQNINKINNNIKVYFLLSSNDPIPINQNQNNIVCGTRITQNICKKYLFNANKKVVSLICGPHPMEDSVKKFLIELGHDKKSISSF